MNTAFYALLLAGAAFAGSHELAGPGWSAHLTPSSRTLRFGGASARMELAGGNASASLSELPGRLRYSEVYDGIHLDFYRAANELEYDFVVTPGADPTKIAMMFPGVNAVVIDHRGELVTGSLRHRAPVAYQMRNGKLIPVASRYVWRGEGIGFEVGDYDRSVPLVIDPVIVYSRFAGGQEEDTAKSLAQDSSSNVYLARDRRSPFFPYFGLPPSLTLQKMDSDGVTLFTRPLTVFQNGDRFVKIAVDGNQNIYVAGNLGPACPANATRIIGSVANPGSFLGIQKLTPDGLATLYLTCVQLDGATGVGELEVDTAGNAYVAGVTTATVYPASAIHGTLETGANVRHAFLTKIDPSGNSFPFSIVVGANSSGAALARDSVGDVYLAGSTSSLFQTVNAALPSFLGGTADAFVMKISANGLQVLFATFLGTSERDDISAMDIENGGDLAVTGATGGIFPVIGAGTPCTGVPDRRSFVARLSLSNGAATRASCLNSVTTASIVTVLTNVVVAGVARSTAALVNPTQGFRSVQDGYVAELDASGQVTFATALGGNSDLEIAGHIVRVAQGYVVAGHSRSPDFPITAGQAHTFSTLNEEAFLARYRRIVR